MENSRTLLGRHFSPRPGTLGLAQLLFWPTGPHRPAQRRTRVRSLCVAHARRLLARQATRSSGGDYSTGGHGGSAGQGGGGGSAPECVPPEKGCGGGGGFNSGGRWRHTAPVTGDGGSEVLQHERLIGMVRHTENDGRGLGGVAHRRRQRWRCSRSISAMPLRRPAVDKRQWGAVVMLVAHSRRKRGGEEKEWWR
jgi:hypothetical protein